MYRVMIVDDEKFVRKSIINRVNWNKLDLNVVAEADNGKKAYNLAIQLRPEIILVDIKMPIMDGIGLINMVKKVLPDTHFIILSGYNDFEYTKSAIKLGVSNYIKKPIDENELQETLRIIIDSLDKYNFEKQRLIDLSLQAKKSIEEQQSKYLQQLIHGSIEPVGDIVKLSGESFILILIYNASIDRSYSDMDDFRKFVLSLTDRSLINSTMPMESINSYAFYVDQSSKLLCVLININNTINNLELSKISRSTIHLIIDGINNSLPGCETYASTYETSGEDISIHEMFKRALYYLKHKILYSNVYIFNRDILDKLRYKNNRKEFWDLLYKAIDHIYEAIENRNFDDISNILDSVFSSRNKEKLTVEMIETITMQIINILNKIMVSYNINSLVSYNDDIITRNFILKYNNVNELKDSIFELIFNLYSNHPNLNENNIVERVKRYIAAHYGEDINVNHIASKFYINPNYLSQIFKSSTNTNLSKYIENIRIERSMELLKGMNIKIRDVAISVGYSDPNYFCKVFKKYTGVTPTEYQNQ